MRESTLRSQFSFVWVLVGNLASVATIWWYGWHAHALLLVYWLETGVVLALYVWKIRRANGTDDPDAIRSYTSFDGEPARAYIGDSKQAIVRAHLRTNAGLWTFLGIFLFIVPFGEDAVIEPATPTVVALAAAGPICYQLYSYWHEYVGLRAYERRGPVSLLVEPAPRMWALFASLLFGLGAVTFTRHPAGAIVVLAFFKTCADLVAHRRHRIRSGG